MMKRVTAQLRNYGILSQALASAGLLFMIGISYGFYRPPLGYAVQLLLALASATVFWLASARTHDYLNDQILEPGVVGDIRLPAAELAKACYSYADWVWNVFAVNLHSMSLGTLLLLASDSHAVLVIDAFLPLVAIISIVYCLAMLRIRPYAIRRLCRPWAHVCGDTLNTWTPNPRNLRPHLALSLWQFIPALTGLTGCIVLANFFDHPEGEIDPFSIFAMAFLLAGIAAACIALPLHLRRIEASSPARRELKITGIRNLILVGVSIWTAANSVTFIRTSTDGGMTWEIGQHWNEELIFLGVAVGLLVVLVSEFIRNRLRNRKS